MSTPSLQLTPSNWFFILIALLVCCYLKVQPAIANKVIVPFVAPSEISQLFP